MRHVIYYFTGTGNTLSLAKKTAEKLEGEVELVPAARFMQMEDAVSDFRKDYKEANVQEKVDKMFGLVESTQRTVDTLQLTFERSTEKIDKSLDDLSDAMSNFSEFTRIIMENPSSLFGGGNSETAEDKK